MDQQNRMREVAEKAIGEYGANHQLALAQETCGDFVGAVGHARRTGAELEQLAGLLAELKVVLASAEHVVGADLVALEVEKHLARVEDGIAIREASTLKVVGD